MLGLAAVSSTVLADGEQPPSGAPLFPEATVSGFALDARTGLPLAGTTIDQIPSFGATTTNQEGLYLLQASYSYGYLELRSQKAGFRQTQTACIWLRPGTNAFGDVKLLRDVEAKPSNDCAPACGADEECLSGTCVSKCNPTCGCYERCSGGKCIPNGDLPPPGTCGAHSKPVGGGVCACDPGFVPSVTGTSCVDPVAKASCPAHSFSGPQGCSCEQGYLLSADGNACLTIDDAVALDTVQSAVTVGSWPVPVAHPYGLAYDGTRFWTVDRVALTLVELEAKAGSAPTLVSETPLEDSSNPSKEISTEILDVKAIGGAVLVLAVKSGANPQRERELARYDTKTKKLTFASIAESQGLTALASDGTRLFGPSRYSQLHVLDAFGKDTAPRRQFTPQPYFAQYATVAGFVATPFATNPTQDLVGYRFGGFVQNQLLFYAGTLYGTGFRAKIDAFNGVHRANATFLGTVLVDVPASHVLGFDTLGLRGFFLVGGVGVAKPEITEVRFATGR